MVNTTAWRPAPTDEARGVRGINIFVRSDADQLSRLVTLVGSGELRLDVARRIPLAALHAEVAANGPLAGKVVVATTD